MLNRTHIDIHIYRLQAGQEEGASERKRPVGILGKKAVWHQTPQTYPAFWIEKQTHWDVS